MPTTPAISTSQADGIICSLIIDMMVQTFTPKFFCSELQHWMAVAVIESDCIQSSTTSANLAICTMASSGACDASAYDANLLDALPHARIVARDLRGIAEDLGEIDGVHA